MSYPRAVDGVKTLLTKERWALGLLLAFTFFSFYLVPSRVQSLRRRLQHQAPAQWAQVTNNGPFRVVLPNKDLGYTDEGMYTMKVRQIYLHGRPYGAWLGSRDLKSWISDCAIYYPLAFFVWLRGGDLTSGWTLAHAVIGCLWLLMFFWIFRAHSQDASYSLLFAAFVFFFLNTLYEGTLLIFRSFRDPSTFMPALRNLPSSIFLPLTIYQRLPSPGVSYLYVAAALGAALLLGRSAQRRPLTALAVGMMCGLLCFVHLFEWIYSVITLCLLAAALPREPGAPKARGFNLIAASVAALAVSGAYYVFTANMTADTMRDTIDLVGVWGRRFRPLSVPFMISAALFWMLAQRRQGAQRLTFLLAAAIQLATFVTSNLPLLIGYDIQFDDHCSYAAALVAIVAASCWIMEQDAIKKRLRPHALVLTAFFCAWFAFKSKSWADQHYKFYGIPQDVAAASKWLNENAAKGSLLLSISAPIQFLMPLETEMRSIVTLPLATIGEAITAEKNLRAFAQLLKTLNVSPDRFLVERWRLGDNEDLDRMAREEDLAQNMNWEAYEKNLWQAFLRLDTRPGAREPRREKVWGQILGYLKEAKPLRTPFYAWVQKSDEPFLLKSPLKSGGQMVYSNPSVSLYSFPKGAWPN